MRIETYEKLKELAQDGNARYMQGGALACESPMPGRLVDVAKIQAEKLALEKTMHLEQVRSMSWQVEQLAERILCSCNVEPEIAIERAERFHLMALEYKSNLESFLKHDKEKILQDEEITEQ